MKALVLGATGATGKDLTKLLLEDQDFSEVHLFVRNNIKSETKKCKIHVVDFDQPKNWQHLVTGDVAFSCMGTTLKDAGSKEAQRKVDYDYQLNFAEAAKNNGVEDFILVSVYGADSGSKLFYNRIKGELEDAVKKLNFEKTTYFQPGILERKNSERSVEVLSIKALNFVNKLGLFKSQKPLPTSVLAKAMVNAAKIKSKGFSEIKLSAIFNFAEKIK
ncbi:NAD(P)H-binding protein [Halpernia frigidisoli]|uniref:NAD(P)H-binding n=1 Tax=Halpernia frigidisoli TaxID=1125876 RepID=A0A1I3IHW7_9FLAO|nr:NAD(P)H-binding protein [Halpernia frigidisoli]SFI47588.1 NAD(P)H-binding [Halpernia frigidisoli]